MKLVNLFQEFLNATVNLNQTRIDLLEDSVKALKSFVRQADWGATVTAFEEQGSWAHKTIIKPVDGDEFDADLLVLVNYVPGWEAADYVTNLGKAFAESQTYKDKAKTWDYCVTINYAGERKVDVAPCVVGRRWSGSLEVCNRTTNTFHRSEPGAYTTWLKERNGYSGSNSFRKVTRLLKYVRDIKQTFTCPSVLLTTLLGNQIEWLDKDKPEFADAPTTLHTVMSRLDDWLQARTYKPVVANPKLSEEDFAANWTEAQYTNFRAFIHKYRGWIDDAFLCDERTESIELWQRIFGDEFAKGEAAGILKGASDSISRVNASLMSTTAAHSDDLVEVVRDYGVSVLPANFNRPTHMRTPPWPKDSSVSAKVSVIASWHPTKASTQSTFIRTGEILPREGGLWFDARVNDFEHVPDGFRVEWRITNTGAVAIGRGQGRGEFYAPQRGNKRWEGLEYRGVHIAEAFIIRTRDGALVGQSKPFNVVIQ